MTKPSSSLSGREIAARLLSFAIPVLIAVEVPGLGTIYLAELCLIGLFPILVVMRGKALLSRSLGVILMLGLVYFSAQVITDVIRETPFGDYARGWSRILFLLLSFVSCYLLIGGNRARMLCYAGGLVAGSTIHLFVHNPLSAIGWKFGFAGPTTTLLLMSFVLIPVLRSPRSLVGPMIMVVLGAFSGFMDFRSWGGVLMLSAAFLSVPAVLRLFGLRPKPLSYGRMFIVGCLLLATGFGALKIYGSAAQSGLLGERSKDKYETQSALGDIGILLGGRSESLVTVQAIMDSPVIGHGSWAKDRYYAELKQLMLYKLGFTNRFIQPENDLIPTHSHLLGAWVEAGLGGALFWFGILMMIMAALRRLYASDDPIRPYLAFLMFLFIWDILFSPFGAQRRLTNGFLLVAMLYALQTSALGWRRRFAEAAPKPVYESWAAAAMRPYDHWAAVGLSEPRPSRWQEPSSASSELHVGDDPETDRDLSEAPEPPELSDLDDEVELDDDEADLDDEPDLNDEPHLDDDEPESSETDADEREEIVEQFDLADPDLTDDDQEEVEEIEEEGESEVLRGRRPTDLGAGGETIRAGFRRLRQQNR